MTKQISLFINHILNATESETQQDTHVDVLELTNQSHRIILHNDDVNTFDWVIECLVKICGHTALQAEQCAMIVHYKGKCDVKSGEIKELKPMCSALLDKGLSAEIV